MNLEDERPARRRRGRELENAILDAAWNELLERGYDGITFEAVAERAGTSRSVLYRRWATRGDLLMAVLHRQSAIRSPPVPDTGSLRGDVLALMRELNGSRSPIMGLISAYLGSVYEETGASPADIRGIYLGDRPRRLDTVVARAVERGELPAGGLPGRVRELPFDLLRHDILMTLRPAGEDTIREIVDDIFLPLVIRHAQQMPCAERRES